MESATPSQPTTGGPTISPVDGSVSPHQPVPPKNVAFELLFDSPQHRARLPMRVGIYPHDDTDSIVTTVKNFYGLYSGPAGSMGVSFEDEHRHTLIARYENFKNGMTVYVKVHEESPSASTAFPAPFPQTVHAPEQLAGRPEEFDRRSLELRAHDISRPGSRASRKRSLSPSAVSTRTAGSFSGKKSRSRSSKNGPFRDADACSDSMNGYSSGDNAPSTTSAKIKDQLGNTDISVENIVEGGRRKRAKFESSELPLFAPPQMPAATSNPSVSPARRVEYHRPALPIGQQALNPFSNPRPINSPRGFGNMPTGAFSTPASDNRRTRANMGTGGGGPNASGILPTPDPTVASCMSEEDKDVAMQLMRLGDTSNISHGRTSASTLDDTFSGRADAASSTGATSEGTSDCEDDQPAVRRQKLDNSELFNPSNGTTSAEFVPAHFSIETGSHNAEYGHADSKKMVKPKLNKAVSTKPNANKNKGPRPISKIRKMLPPAIYGPMSPTSAASLKTSILPINGTGGTGEDEQPDLSSKPRCQRCRKSKKGCDRQRPCGRCRDAGLSADQCISEDEGNGRKGRYGRHMGVPIKKEDLPALPQQVLLPGAPITSVTATNLDKTKKRKR